MPFSLKDRDISSDISHVRSVRDCTVQILTGCKSLCEREETLHRAVSHIFKNRGV